MHDGGAGDLSGVWTEPFSDSADFYDAIYTTERDYAAQASWLTQIALKVYPQAGTWLDVACGTGLHLEHLRRRFSCEGVDASEAMLAIARRRNPELTFYRGDMRNFSIGRSFDVLSCLFSSITYALDLHGLGRTLKTFARHLVPGGVCFVEPFITYDQWLGRPTGHIRSVDLPALSVAMVDRVERHGRKVTREVAYAVATPMGLRQVLERHTFGLFRQDDYVKAFEASGFRVDFDPEGFDPSRGMFIATRISP
jgi:ubiquinone/menaquinone biosynthesis C-methylase UbiE